MDGLLQSQMQPQAEAGPMGAEAEAAPPMPPEDDAAPSGGDLSPEALEAKMPLEGKLKEQLDRVVLAGLKVMFSEQSHQLMLDQLKQPGDVVDKLAQGIAGLVAMLFEQSQRAIPPQLLIPAGVLLMAHAVEWLKKAGIDVTPQQFAQALTKMTETLLQQGGVDPAKLEQQIDTMQPPGAQGAAPAQPEGV